MEKQIVEYRDLGHMDYKAAWDYQEALMRKNLEIKSQALKGETQNAGAIYHPSSTIHHLLFVEHSAVYTLGKSGKPEHVLINEEQREEKGIQFFHTNRGGDITYHGP